MKEILLIGPLPPPVTGNSIAFSDLVEGCVRGGDYHAVLDISARKASRVVRSRVGRRVLDYLLVAPRAFRLILRSSGVVYLTVAQSWAGCLRDLLFVGLARVRCRPVVLHVHGGNYDTFYASLGCFRKLLVRRFLLSAESIILLSERLVPMMSFEPRVSAAIRVVPNGVVTEGAVSETRGARQSSPFRVLFLSNLIESKGYLTVLRAAGVVQSRLGKGCVEFLFAGQVMLNPPDDQEVHNERQANQLISTLLSELAIEDCVRLLGVVKGDIKRELLEMSSVLVLPTRYNNEGQPICILEAMAHGLPVISTNYRAIPDMVIDGETGFLTPHDDFVALADAIVALFCDRSLHARLSRNATEHVRRFFDVDSYIESVRQIIRDAGSCS